MKTQQTILIVDDNPDNLTVLGNILFQDDRNLLFAQNGTVALIFAKKRKPTLILLDIMMPDMDGFEVCRQLKQDATLSEIPVIFLSAKTAKDDVIAGLELGAVDYVTKPFNQKELMTRINTHLELQAAKEALQEALAAKEEALATKDKLFSIISHDLGNVFAGLLGFTRILVENEVQENEKNKYIQNLFQASKNGYNLLKNLLQWSRSQTDRLQVKPVAINLQNLVHQNIQLLKNHAKAKNIHFFSHIDEDASSVFADQDMLDTVIRNLLSNALKFTPELGTVRVTAEPIEDNLVEISVIDTGIGIIPDKIDKLFQINTNRTRGTADEKGNGFGLVLCKELVEKCGGVIGIESNIGKGSRFYVRLPIKKE
jgi:two-component system, sensor histidine kinase and response regulator